MNNIKKSRIHLFLECFVMIYSIFIAFYLIDAFVQFSWPYIDWKAVRIVSVIATFFSLTYSITVKLK